jgi:hypothetical protein
MQASFLDTVKTVLSGFIGVRKGAAHDSARLNPPHDRPPRRQLK